MQARCSAPASQRTPALVAALPARAARTPRLPIAPALAPTRSSSSVRPSSRRALTMAALAAEDADGALATIIDGKAIAATIRGEIAAGCAELKAQTGGTPGLAVVLVGSRGDSETYVRSKIKACEEVGIASFSATLPEDVSQEELLRIVAGFNANPDVHGILVQLPLPPHIDETAVLDAIDLAKDVDGFHPANIGAAAMRGRDPLYVSCTPKGCVELLVRTGIPIAGKRAVVVGRSNIVGLPAAMLLMGKDATVTIVHSRTPDPASIVRTADIVIAAAGQAEMIKGDWLKPGCAVIDVGTNPVPDPTKKRGYRLVGDVAFEEASGVAAFITPVPGGVGPMTITMLLANTLEGAKRAAAEAAK